MQFSAPITFFGLVLVSALHNVNVRHSTASELNWSVRELQSPAVELSLNLKLKRLITENCDHEDDFIHQAFLANVCGIS